MLGASGAPRRATASAAALGFPLHSCYPANEFTVWNDFGAFRTLADGSIFGGSSDATWSVGSKVTGNRGSSLVEATPGSLHGSVMTAKLHVPGVAHEVNFIGDGKGEEFRARAGLPAGVTPGPGKVCPGIDFGL